MEINTMTKMDTVLAGGAGILMVVVLMAAIICLLCRFFTGNGRDIADRIAVAVFSCLLVGAGYAYMQFAAAVPAEKFYMPVFQSAGRVVFYGSAALGACGFALAIILLIFPGTAGKSRKPDRPVMM